MDNIYAIHAYESYFQGLHGVESFEVIEARSDKEAEQYAYEMAQNVVDDYSYIWESDYDEDEDCFEEEGGEFEIYKLIEETNASLEELNEEWDNDPKGFLNKYANKQIY